MILLTLACRTFRSTDRRALLVALVLALVMQGLGVGVAAVQGRPHAHRESVLVDFRRDPGHANWHDEGVTAWFGHHHEIALRHFHAVDDPSVVFSAAEDSADRKAQDVSLSLELTIAAFIAIVGTWVFGSFDGLSHRQLPGNGWQPTTGWRARLERPPQSA